MKIKTICRVGSSYGKDPESEPHYVYYHTEAKPDKANLDHEFRMLAQTNPRLAHFCQQRHIGLQYLSD
jgi:hypothetical protein